MICKYQSIKTDLGLACSLCQDFSFFPLGKKLPVAPSGNDTADAAELTVLLL